MGKDKNQLYFDRICKYIVQNLYLLIIVDNNGHIYHINSQYAEILGYRDTELTGKDVRDIISNTRLMEVINNGKHIPGEFFVLKNGEPVIAERFPIRDDSGHVIGAYSIAAIRNVDEAKISSMHKKLDSLKKENQYYKYILEQQKKEDSKTNELIGFSAPIQALKKTILEIAPSSLSVLITGETGVGKEIFANAIHQNSKRALGPFIKINCAAIPKDLIESELFGYEDGAFTGAKKGGRIGKFELANKGTLLLDEIGEMPYDLQSKLLRVLQEKKMERIGGTKEIPLDFRLICSTNCDLEKMVEEGTFRRDIYYRTNVVELKVPPLRERTEDIEPLSKFLIQKMNLIHGCMVEGIHPDVLAMFQRYHWKGNVRELEHVLERAIVVKGSGVLETSDFLFFQERIGNPATKETHLTFKNNKMQSEILSIRSALQQTNGNKTEAARLLGISRSLLYKKIAQYQIDIPKNPT